MDKKQIMSWVLGQLKENEEIQKTELFKAGEDLEIKAVQINHALKALSGQIDMIKKGGKVFVRLSPETPEETSETPETPKGVKELKKAPETERPRRTLVITEEEAEGLSLLNLRTPPVKAELKYPRGVTKEMYEEFKARILVDENKSIIWDLVGNFNGARNIAITMWEPENPQANEDGRVFYRWDNPEETWPLMKQLCKILDLFEAQEAKAGETGGE